MYVDVAAKGNLDVKINFISPHHQSPIRRETDLRPLCRLPAEWIFRGTIHRHKFRAGQRGLIIFQGSGGSATRRCHPYIPTCAGSSHARRRASARRRIGPACNIATPTTVTMVTCQVLSPLTTPPWTIPVCREKCRLSTLCIPAAPGRLPCGADVRSGCSRSCYRIRTIVLIVSSVSSVPYNALKRIREES